MAKLLFKIEKNETCNVSNFAVVNEQMGGGGGGGGLQSFEGWLCLLFEKFLIW